MRVVFCSTEVVPFAKTGGLGDVCGALPLALERQGIEPAIVMPLYSFIDKQQFALKKVNTYAWMTKIGKNVPVYFIDHKEYYGRDGLYGYGYGDYSDNLERFHYLCAKTIELFKELKWKVDIFHVHDWQAALVPTLLKNKYRTHAFYKSTRSVLSIHNMAYQGIFPKIFFSKLGLDRRLFSIHGLEYFDQVNLLKAGLIFADRVATVSPQYAREIQTSALGCGLDGVLRNRVEGVTGIINGIDYDIWDPQRDLMIQRNYSLKNVEVKAENKAFLQQALGLPVKSDAAVLGFVGRLTQQKGLDVIVAVLKELVNKNIQLIFLGVGEDKYEAQLKKVAKQFPQKIIFKQKFSEPLAHQIYAGSDIFLMPSAFEPCGLSQMISLRYGTIPIVHKTGGLADTVTDVRADKNQGNGFSFAPLDGAGFWTALDDALKYFAKKDAWGKLVERGMGQDFSWGKSAKQYVKFYETVKGR